MFAALGVGGGGSLIAGVGTILAIVPFVFYKYGKQIRIRSKFSPTGGKNKQSKDEESANGGNSGVRAPSDQDSASSSDSDSSIRSNGAEKKSGQPTAPSDGATSSHHNADDEKTNRT